MARTTTFTKGSGAYRCGCCSRLTRDDGNGDSVNVMLCTQCFELGGYQNMVADGERLDHADALNVKSLIEEVIKRGGGDVWCYADFKI